MSAAEIFNSYPNEVVAHQCGSQFISVNRMQISLLTQLMRIYEDPRLVLTNAADVGGPTKEYFHEAISILSKVDTLNNIQLFGGQEGQLLPLYGVDAISSGCRQVQKSDRINLDRQSGSDQLGSTRTNSDWIKK